MRKRFNALVDLWFRYEHRLGLGALVAGFVFDLFIADRPDSLANNVLLLSYLFIVGSIILLLNVLKRRARVRGLAAAEPLLLLLILQFCFGGLSSNLLVLYGRSGTLAGSILFLFLLLGIAVGNEFLRGRYALLRFNIAVYYVLLLTYCIIAVPTFLLHYIGLGAFLLSGAVSLLLMGAFLTLLRFTLGKKEHRSLLESAGIVVGIFVLFFGAYWAQIIPPVPLSLKSSGIYHSIEKSGTNFYATYEPTPLLEFWRSTSATFHAAPGESAYCFSAVFAPTDLSTPVYHRFERYEQEGAKWVTVSRMAFPVHGGREGGYRGYSAVTSPVEGRWRCNVETATGALIGRVSFTVVKTATTTLATARL